MNQETVWDVLDPPESTVSSSSSASPSTKDNGTAVWRANVNNGTEIWETNVRSGGKGQSGATVSGASGSQQPWGANPTSNIGGTWGEEEDASNMWTGVPQGNSTVGNGNNNGGGSLVSSVSMGNPGLSGNVVASSSSTWGSNNGGGNGSNEKVWVAPSKEKHHWGTNGAVSGTVGSSGWGDAPVGTPTANGIDDGTSAWSSSSNNKMNVPRPALPLKDIRPSGWEEPSPPMSRRGLTAVDDGTAVWGNPHNQTKVCRWKDMPSTSTKNGTVGHGSQGPLSSSQPSTPTQGQVPPTASGVLRIPPSTPTSVKPDAGINVWNKSNPHSRYCYQTESCLSKPPVVKGVI